MGVEDKLTYIKRKVEANYLNDVYKNFSMTTATMSKQQIEQQQSHAFSSMNINVPSPEAEERLLKTCFDFSKILN